MSVKNMDDQKKKVALVALDYICLLYTSDAADEV